jgi:UTP:GlnB (protein PII) uridylyltransferase
MPDADMANRNLTPNELEKAHELLTEIRQWLGLLAGDDQLLLFAYRRKVVKELGYDERSKPIVRARLKTRKWELQNHQCAHCAKEMALTYSELDRKNAAGGYTEENTELVHAAYHQARQAEKRYS